MYFVRDGICTARSGKDPSKVYRNFEPGTFFGEWAVLTGGKRTSDVVTATYCDLLVLTQSDFVGMLEQYPDYKHKFQQLSDSRQTQEAEDDTAHRQRAVKRWMKAGQVVKTMVRLKKSAGDDETEDAAGGKTLPAGGRRSSLKSVLRGQDDARIGLSVSR